MATVRGMTPEAIRALLKKEIGDYQALSIAVNSAKGASESAITGVENLRNDLENMEFHFDDSALSEAMDEFKTDMEELNVSLEEVKTEALARENKLTALEVALNGDRTQFTEEMRNMAQELSDSKAQLEQDLAEVSEQLAQNVADVGDKLSSELQNANKTLSEDLAKDLEQLNTDLTETFGKDLKDLESRQNTKADALDKELKDYKSNTDSKMSTILSDMEKAKAYADGFLQPGNLVWNPMALDDARYIRAKNSGATVKSMPSGGRDSVGALQITKKSSVDTYVDYGGSNNATFELKKGTVVEVSAWFKPTVKIPANAIGLKVGYSQNTQYNSTELPANQWTQIVGEVTYKGDTVLASYFSLMTKSSFPVNASVIVSNPWAKLKVTSDLIVDGAVTSKSIATGAVVAGKIAANAITANNIQSDAITSDKIKAGAVIAAKIATNAVSADKIAANAVSADKIAANAVTAAKIVTNAVTADKVAANAIGTNKLAANAVTAAKIAANAVSADKIAANAVTAAKIAADAVTADKVAANSINATHMVLAQPGNLIANGSLVQGGAGWNSSLTFHEVASQTTPPNGRYLMTKAGQGALEAHGRDNWFDVQPGASYAFEIWLYANKPNSNIFIECRDQEGLHAGIAGKVVNDGDLATGGGNYLVNNRTLGTQWKRYSCVYTMRDTTTRARLAGFYFNHLNGSERNAQVAFGGVSLRPMADASLIVDGGIQARHITAGAVTTDHMSANSISGDRIKSDTLDAKKIKARSITSDKIKVGAITGNEIAANSITSGKIVANAIGANHIQANAVTASEIAANAVTASEIAANAVTADKIAANAVTADKIAANAVTADKVAANSISAQKLQITPGNLFPDPHFQDPCWKALYSTGYNGSIELKGTGAQTGVYYQPSGVTKDTALKVEPGAVYRLTTGARFGGTGGVTFVSVYCRYVNTADTTKILKVGQIPRTNLVSYKIGTVSTNLTFPTDMKSGECTIGFFVERSHPDGSVSLWDVQLVRAADASLIVDGSIQGRHIQANSINGDRIVAGTLDAKAIKAGTITATQVNAEDILLTKDGDSSLKGQWDDMSVALEMLQSGQMSLSKLLNNHISAKRGFVFYDGGDFYGSDYAKSLFSKESVQIVATGSWKGRVLHIKVGENYSNELRASKVEVSYREIDTARRVIDSMLGATQNILLYELDPVEPDSYLLIPAKNWSMTRSTWATVPNMSVTMPDGTESVAVSGTIYFTAVNRGSTYGIRVLIAGKEVWKWTSTRFGPLGPLGEKTWRYNFSHSGDAKPGQKVEIQTYSSAPNSNQRVVTDATTVLVTVYTSV